MCFCVVPRQSWNKDAFMNKSVGKSSEPSEMENDVKQHSTEPIPESFGVIVEKLDQVMTDPNFWGQVHMICDLVGVFENLARPGDR